MKRTAHLSPMLHALLLVLFGCFFTVPIFIISVLNYTILSSLTQFGAPFVWVLGWSVVGFGCITNVVYIFVYWSQVWWKSFLPLLSLGLMLTAFQRLPLADWSLALDMSIKQTNRTRVIAQLSEQFAYERTVSQLVRLPVPMQYLSAGGGEVWVEKADARLSVMFYLWRGVLATSSGFVVYTSDNALPSSYIGYEVYEKRVQENWYVVVMQ